MNNIMNLISQFKNAPNKANFLMSIANPQQKELLSNMNGKNKEEKAQKIADYCNENGITKEQLSNLMKLF